MAHLRARPVLRTGGIEGGHMEAKAVRETNGCGTEWRSGSEDFGDTWGGVQSRRRGWEGCLLRRGAHVCGDRDCARA